MGLQRQNPSDDPEELQKKLSNDQVEFESENPAEDGVTGQREAADRRKQPKKQNLQQRKQNDVNKDQEIEDSNDLDYEGDAGDLSYRNQSGIDYESIQEGELRHNEQAKKSHPSSKRYPNERSRRAQEELPVEGQIRSAKSADVDSARDDNGERRIPGERTYEEEDKQEEQLSENQERQQPKWQTRQ